MKISIIGSEEQLPFESKNSIFLISEKRKEKLNFFNIYYLIVFDEKNEKHFIGYVKIGHFKTKNKSRLTKLPVVFDSLNDVYFSVGQDETYYEKINNLGHILRTTILTSLNDIALLDSYFQKVVINNELRKSFFRDTSILTVKGQFRRLANGGARLTSYNFSYIINKTNNNLQERSLLFNVNPESNPPTNIHVITGRNGVGKTFLLRNMASSLLEPGSRSRKIGKFESGMFKQPTDIFSNLIVISFSVFDEANEFIGYSRLKSIINYSYIGLKDAVYPPKTISKSKSPNMIKKEFSKSFESVCIEPKKNRMKLALETLESDPIFKDSQFTSLLEIENQKELINSVQKYYENLSAGHKNVLFIITKLIETVEEKSLILIDEPESYLHPPLLSAFIRSLSDLLFDRNGVAIISTHSPVVLQEVPRSCIWMLRRSGNLLTTERLTIESFGENVGTLTSEVFGLEVTNSGFHKLLIDASERYSTYLEALDSFGNQLGMEARAILRSLYSDKERN